MAAPGRPGRIQPILAVVAGAWALAALQAVAGQPSPLDERQWAILNRVTWGASEADAAQIRKLGVDRWLDRQLHPSRGDPLPPDAQAQIDDLVDLREPLYQAVLDSRAKQQASAEIADPDARP